MKLLLLDDETVLVEVFKHLLEMLSFEVEAFDSCSDALKYIETSLREPPKCLIIDYNLSEMGGLEFLNKARKLLPDVPALVVSGDSNCASHLEGISKTGFLMKPFLVDELRNAILVTQSL